MPSKGTFIKVGIYVDVANMYNNGGQKMQYDVLREFACRDDGTPVRMNAYVTLDAERSERDEVYRKGTQNFHSALRDLGYKVIVKEISWYQDENGAVMEKPMPILTWRWMPCCNPKTWTGY